MPEGWNIRNQWQFERFIQCFESWDFESKNLRFEIKKHSGQISKEARGLYWGFWLPAMVKKFGNYVEGKTKAEKIEKMHILLKHKLLGYKTTVVGKTEVTELKSTSDKAMDSSAFCEYMSKVDAWAVDHGIQLPRPEDNEYQLWIDAQEAA